MAGLRMCTCFVGRSQKSYGHNVSMRRVLLLLSLIVLINGNAYKFRQFQVSWFDRVTLSHEDIERTGEDKTDLQHELRILVQNM